MSKPIKREGGRVTCSDQRQGTRAELARVSARYAVGTEEMVDGEVLNVSMGGMFLRATRPLPPGTHIDLELRIVGEEGPLRGTGEVMWTREAPTAEGAPSGMGLRFVGLDPKACDVISRLVVVREQTIHGLGPEDATAPSSTRAPEPSVPLDLVRKKEETPVRLVKRKDGPREDAPPDEAGEPTSLPAIVIDAKRAAESAGDPPSRSAEARRPRRNVGPPPRAGLAAAPIVGTAALVLLAIVPAGDSPSAPAFAAATPDDVRLVNAFVSVAPPVAALALRPTVPTEVVPPKVDPAPPPGRRADNTLALSPFESNVTAPPALSAVSASPPPKHAGAHARAKPRAVALP
jgi:uncharacterized protein (TIGR02266 family)